jgi:hypothetical protein
MRVAITRAGRIQVDEIIEFEVQKNGDVVLWTPVGLEDIIVHGMSTPDIERAARELLHDGRTNLTMFESEYDEGEIDYDEEVRGREILCEHCEWRFVIPDRNAERCFCPLCGAYIDVVTNMLS